METPALDEYGRDLTGGARKGGLDPVVAGRMRSIMAIEVLSRRTKNNPVLIGEPGVGRPPSSRAIGPAHRQRQRARHAQGPQGGRARSDRHVWRGSKYRGEFEELYQEGHRRRCASTPTDRVVHRRGATLVGAGSSEGGMDAANILSKPALSRGELHVVARPPPCDEYRQAHREGTPP
ncbi:hypothetical protein [Nonomuraea dietziae]|uniref:hypothetical protein n=1 Tax=Nonomuraea dietziae TaxID=65515 RepID=UPI0031D496AF